MSNIVDEIRGTLQAELKGVLEKRDDVSEKLVKMVDEFKAKSDSETGVLREAMDKTTNNIKEISTNIEALEKQIRRGVSSQSYKSFGTQFVEAPEFDAASLKSSPRSFTLEAKDISNAGNTATNVSRSVLVPEQQSGFVQPPEIALRVRSLIMPGQTSSGSIRSIRETGYTNNAGPVAELGTIKKSQISFGEQTIPVEKIAHYISASMEILDDASMLRGYIDGRGRYGLNLIEEDQLLNGNGQQPNLRGLIPEATAFDASSLNGYTPANLVDEIRIAKLQTRKALYPASGVVLSPDDWASIELLKDTQGAYLYSSVISGAVPSLWGLPVVVSDNIAPGSFLVGAFSLAAQLWDRMGLTVTVSTEDGDNFKNDRVSIKFEKRLALEVSRPEAFVYKAPPAPPSE